MPAFSEPAIASMFLKSAREVMGETLQGKDLQIQVCNERKHILDMFKMIASLEPGAIVAYNPLPLTGPPQDNVGELVLQSAPRMMLGQEYDMEEWQKLLDSYVASSKTP